MNLTQLVLAPVELNGTHSISVENALKEVFQTFQTSVEENTVLSTQLADYIFVPLSYLLKKPAQSNIQSRYLLKIIGLLIKHCWTQAGSAPYLLMKQLFPLITFLTGGSPNPGKDKEDASPKPLELKLSGVETLHVLFKSLAIQKKAGKFDFFQNVENLPPLGHVVTVLLDFAQTDSVELQNNSLSTLSCLFFDIINDGEILSYILPGNVSVLTKIICKLNTHYTVMIRSIALLSRLLVVVYNDDELKPDLNELNKIEDVFNDEITENFDLVILKDDKFKKVHRTNSWLKGTSNQVKLSITNIKQRVSKDNLKHQVNQEFLKFANTILQYCIFSLNSSIPVIIDILGMLSNDQRLEVSHLSTNFEKNNQLINTALSSNLINQIAAFSSVIQSSNEDKIILNMNSIEFLVKNLDDGNDFLLNKLVLDINSELSNQFKKNNKKTELVTISNNSSNSYNELVMISKELNFSGHEVRQFYSYFSEVFTESVETKLNSLIQTIGSKVSNVSNLVQDLLAEEVHSLNEKAIAVFVATNLVKGFYSESLSIDDFLQVDEVDKSPVNDDSVYLILEESKKLLDETTELQISKEIVRINSISLSAIGEVCKLLKSEMEVELIDYLYPVIDSLASSSDEIRQQAVNTSLIIANTLYNGSLNELILKNCDYLIDSISIRLSNALTMKTSSILTVLTKIVGYEIIENFTDINNIIFNLIDSYHGYEDLCFQFFLFFEIVADEIAKEFVIERLQIDYDVSSSSYAPWGIQNINQVINLLDKSKREIETNFGDEEVTKENGVVTRDDTGFHVEKDSDDEEEDQQEASNKETWTCVIPQNIYKLLQQIVYYGDRLLTHPSVRLQLQILRVYEKVIPLLSSSNKNLLPIVSKIWPVLAKLLERSSDIRILMDCSKVVKLCLKYCGSFLSQRFIEFWKLFKSNSFFQTNKIGDRQQTQLVLPGVSQKCYELIADMLIEGLNSCGRRLPDLIVEEVIKVCGCNVDIDKFGINSDIAWGVKYEQHGVVGLTQPADFKDYKFIDLGSR